MEALRDSVARCEEPAAAPRTDVPGQGGLLESLELPKELSTAEAAAILGCCKHTILRYCEDGLLEWRNTAPSSSNRPVYRFTLRSVLELRLGYQRGNPRPPLPPDESKRRRKTVNPSAFKPKHLRRKNSGGEKA
jgi:hypothetical protein